MTQPRSTSSPADALGATIANQSARSSALEQVAHRHPTLMGRGVVAAKQVDISNNITGITTIPTDINTLSLEFVADPSRLYRVTVVANMRSSVVNDGIRMYLTTDTGVVLRSSTVNGMATTLATNHLEHLMTGDGLVKLKVQVARVSGSGTIDVFRSETQWLPFMIVEDVAGLPSPYVIAGGASIDTITDIGGTLYRVISFFNSGTLQIQNGDISSLEYLIVAGGGGGGGAFPNQGLGAGGGAGGYLTNVGGTPLAISSGIYSVTIGAGGTGGTGSALGSDGGASSAFGITASGGGGGGSWNILPRTGGSGGGGANNGAPTNVGAAGIAGQGNSGGNGSIYAAASGSTSCGGGGGAGGAGGNATTTVAGAGGVGLSNNITGTSIFYAGGGGGSGTNTGGAGGNGGGGAGRVGGTSGNGFAGASTLGGGGGGALDRNVANYTGGAGGSGCVIIRFPYIPTSFQQ